MSSWERQLYEIGTNSYKLWILEFYSLKLVFNVLQYGNKIVVLLL